MKIEDFKKIQLPDAPGVYFFRKAVTEPGADGEIVYIGRATSLRDRVRSYFNDDLIVTRGPLILDMVTGADLITWVETDSVLEAIILEAELIKKHQPLANTKEKDNRSFNYVVITDEDYPRVLIERGRNIEKSVEIDGVIKRGKEKNLKIKLKIKKIFGPYTNGQLLRDSMKIIRKIFPYRDACMPGSSRACFNHQIGLCPGVCIGAISRNDYAKRVRLISMFLEGRKPDVVRELNDNMHEYASSMEFEKAHEAKRMLTALAHIQDVALIKDDRLSVRIRHSDALIFDEKTGANFDPQRIEAYDVAHISGKHIVGVMVVLNGAGTGNSEFDKRGYRKFKIRTTDTANEVKSLGEILTRRLAHLEWPLPAYIVVDGNQIQLKVAEQSIDQNTAARTFGVKVLSVVKDDKHRAREILGFTNTELINNQTLQKDIIKINAEAHRFALAYHRLARSRDMLGKPSFKKTKLK